MSGGHGIGIETTPPRGHIPVVVLKSALSYDAPIANRVADESADDVEIQAALNSVAAQKGGVVQLTDGDGYLNAPVTVADGMTLRGVGPGMAGTKRGTYLYHTWNDNTKDALSITGDYAAIENLGVTITGATPAARSGISVIDGVNNFILRNVDVHGAYATANVYILGGIAGLLENISAIGGAYGIRFAVGATQHPNANVIENAWCSDNTVAGLLLESNGPADDQGNNLVLGGVFQGTLQPLGIHLKGLETCTVVAPHMENSGGGAGVIQMQIEDCRGATVIGGLWSPSAGTGIKIINSTVTLVGVYMLSSGTATELDVDATSTVRVVGGLIDTTKVTIAAGGVVTYIMAGNYASFGAAYLDIGEMTAPAAPAANTARLYVDDNGAGKTRLSVRFPTGAVQVLATEP